MTPDEFVNSLTTEQYIRLLDMADPSPMTDAEKVYYNSLNDDELLAELLA